MIAILKQQKEKFSFQLFSLTIEELNEGTFFDTLATRDGYFGQSQYINGAIQIF